MLAGRATGASRMDRLIKPAAWIVLASILSQRFDAIALTAAQMLVLVICSVPVVLIGRGAA